MISDLSTSQRLLVIVKKLKNNEEMSKLRISWSVSFFALFPEFLDSKEESIPFLWDGEFLPEELFLFCFGYSCIH